MIKKTYGDILYYYTDTPAPISYTPILIIKQALSNFTVKSRYLFNDLG